MDQDNPRPLRSVSEDFQKSPILLLGEVDSGDGKEMKLSGVVLAATAAAATSDAPTSARPQNFVIMLADDVGWGDWSRTGSPARTPHLDAMSRADHGVWFHRAYSGNPICSPTRASLHTVRAVFIFFLSYSLMSSMKHAAGPCSPMCVCVRVCVLHGRAVLQQGRVSQV